MAGRSTPSNYRHIIDWLVRKPGAFENYLYREALFPTSRFRMAYDALRQSHGERGTKEYLGILYLAARQSETAVDEALRALLASGQPVTRRAVEALVQRAEEVPAVTEVTVEEVDLSSFDLKRLPAKVARQVRSLLDGSFVDRRENLLLFGKTGTGKTHLLSAIAQELVRQGRKVISSPCALLVQELLVAKRDLKLSRVLKRLSKCEVLLIDDIGYVQQSREEMEVLFTLLAERYERGTVMLTSNLPFSKWETIFKDPMTTAAAIDRLVHHSVILELNIPSYRLEEAKRTKPPEAA